MLLIGNLFASGPEISFLAPLPIDTTVTARIIRPHSKDVGVASPNKVNFLFLLSCPSGGMQNQFFAGLFPPNPEGGIPDVLA